MLTQYEVVAYGVAYNLSKKVAVKDLETKVTSIWSDKEFTDWSGSGVTSARRLPKLLPYGRKLFSND